MGHKNFFIKIYRDLGFIEATFDWVEERNRLAIKTVIKEVRPDFVLFDGDCAYKAGLMVNPKVFRRLVYERTRKPFPILGIWESPTSSIRMGSWMT